MHVRTCIMKSILFGGGANACISKSLSTISRWRQVCWPIIYRYFFLNKKKTLYVLKIAEFCGFIKGRVFELSFSFENVEERWKERKLTERKLKNLEEVIKKKWFYLYMYMYVSWKLGAFPHEYLPKFCDLQWKEQV